MRWLFTTGIALDISGAVMVLGAILSTRASEVAKQAGTYPGYNEEVLRARVLERRYAFSGALLLVSGFLLQLAGYAWFFRSWWMVAYAIGVAACAILLARLVVRRGRSRFFERADELMRKAVE